MFGSQCYFDEEVWESQGLVRAPLEALLGAWCRRKPIPTDLGPPTAGLSATIAADTTRVGQPQAGEGALTYPNHHSSLSLHFRQRSCLGKVAKPSHQMGHEGILGMRNQSSLMLQLSHSLVCGSRYDSG